MWSGAPSLVLQVSEESCGHIWFTRGKRGTQAQPLQPSEELLLQEKLPGIEKIWEIFFFVRTGNAGLSSVLL